MSSREIARPLIALSVLVFALLLAPHRSRGQTCPGDIDGDGWVTANDLAIVTSLASGEVEEPALKARADVNSDGMITAADIVLVTQLQGSNCSAVTATPPFTRTPRPTPTPSPTFAGASPTGSPVATSTPGCMVVPAQFGTINGTLTADDCQQSINGTLRHTDVYTITGTPGQSITVQVTATGPTPIVPYVAVVDPSGQFGEVTGPPPVQFVVNSSLPYEIMVASKPSAAQEFGPYQLTLTQTACPTPVALTIGDPAKLATLKANDCPDPGWPSTGDFLNPADIYTFQVSIVPTNIAIVMRQRSAADDIYPAFSVLTPDRIEEVTQDNNWDCTNWDLDNPLVCSQAQFLALQAGTYTIIAAGGTGSYSLRLSSPLCKATALSNIPSAPPTPCSTKSGPGCVVGSLSASTNCAAPLPIPGISDDAPADQSSPADLYTFTASAGDVISVSMISDDDAHLYLLGPAPGNQLVTQDDDSLDDTDSQLAATLVQPGTYTIVAANNNGLYPDDDPVGYTLQVQQCAARAGLSPTSAGVALNETFSGTDCVGFGSEPFRSYSFTGTAGQFVTVAMTSDDVDAYLRLLAPDGSVVENDDDLLASLTTDAQVFRILPVSGTYFAEASTSGGIDLTSPSSFSIQAQTCPTIPVVPGTSAPVSIEGSFDDTDCQATDGTKFDALVFTPAAVPSVASLLPPDNGCLTALLAEGAQTPDGGCSSDPLDVPMLTQRPYGFIVSADDPDNRDPYTVLLSNCPLSSMTYGDTRTSSITGSDCQAADGTPSEWSLFRGGANLVHFNWGFYGTLTAGFPARIVLSDVEGTGKIGSIDEDDTSMFALGTDLDALLSVGGRTPADQGPYTLSFDPASYRQ